MADSWTVQVGRDNSAGRVSEWVDVVPHQGPDELVQVWLDMVGGTVAPRSGHVVTC